MVALAPIDRPSPDQAGVVGSYDGSMPDLLQLSVGLPERSFEAGEVLLAEGGDGGRLLVLVAGTVEVRKGDLVLAVVDEPGSCLGELAALLARSHSATVTARTPTTVREAADGGGFLHDHPEAALAVATELARRLDALNTYLVDVRQQYDGAGGHLDVLHEVLADLGGRRAKPVELGSDREPDPLY